METLNAAWEGSEETLRAALAYSRRGWAVLPLLHLEKFPATAHGVKDATSDPKQIEAWWTEGNFGIAIACGRISNIVVVDVDTKSGGLESLGRLTDGQIIDTPTQRTPSGGLHLVFEYPDGFDITNSVGKVAPGIDIRSTSGYIAAYPTVLRNGTPYKWEISAAKVKPAPLPGWVLDAVRTGEPAYKAQGTILEGQGRNNFLTSWAGRLRADGIDDEETMYTLLSAMNTLRCVPAIEDEVVRSLAHRSVQWEADRALRSIDGKKWVGRLPHLAKRP
jgi:hypothetical protein